MKLLLKIIIVFILLCDFYNTNAQIVPISTHYTVLRDKYNPAFNGLEGGLGVVANYRTQWTELQKAPKTLNLVADIYLPQIKSGLGVNIANDRLGAYNQTAIALAYNFIQPIKEKFKIGIGIQAGANISKLNGNLLVTPQGDYTNGTNHNDNVLSNNIVKSVAPIFDFGIALHHKNFDIGVAVQNLINYKYKYEGSINNLNTSFGRTLNFTAKGKVDIGENIHIIPSVNMLTDFKNVQTDVTIMAGFKYFIDAGINVRGYNKNSFESLSPIIMIAPVKSLKLTYSYDFNLNALKQVNDGSHEISLSYFLDSKNLFKQPKMINHPRFL